MYDVIAKCIKTMKNSKKIASFIPSLKGYLQYNTIQYNTIQYNTIQYNTIQYDTIRYDTIRYNKAIQI